MDARYWCLLACLMTTPVLADQQAAQEAQEQQQIRDVCRQAQASGGLIDRTHDWMSRTVCWPSRWVDHFFADPNHAIDEQPGTLLRVISAYRWQDDHDSGSDLNIRAKAELPNAENRLSLVFRTDSDRDDELRDDLASRPEQVGNNNNNGFRSALRWVVTTSDRMDIDLDAGLRSQLKVFTRARYRWRYQLPGGKTWFRFTQKGYWEDPEGFGTSSLFELDRPITPVTSFRFSNEIELTEENNEAGRNWYFNQGGALYFRLGKRSGIGLYASYDAYTRPVTAIETWRVSLRFRRNIWRDWLYYEVEPYAFWPREDNFKGVTGVVFRVETQFGLVDD
ncbi:hypothetical protein A11A3_10426 [Alcanivorax hongdengensis A-11-3]|uniref:Uncharacterized protein n=1 Tax=Alcanivorax hongdengensis A-11-3 TaxID=1177179 RepID=L0WD71_9GAMM|nr:hypothetical protein [Alcanivorax hongdengensis]EKF74067.1 hypothetical protein A11A3_10426 [Alcanivorax hongdengensis A-11-3]